MTSANIDNTFSDLDTHAKTSLGTMVLQGPSTFPQRKNISD